MSAALWAGTIALLLGIILVDLIIVDRRPHAFGAREASRWVLFYVALALAFATFVTAAFGASYGGQFLAGYITEYSLSVDNLFVFMVIMSSFAVPAEHRHRVLLVGVVIALLLRGILIVLGAAAIQRFAATFFLFGGFLLYTAFHVWRSGAEEADPEGNRLIHLIERRVPTTRQYHGANLVVRIDGRRFITPMLLVMLAIGTTDLLFALDSIPAVFGLTEEAYLVFTANAFALMGLRQLFFMLHGLLDRLIYLSKGLAVILAFIAVKLLLHALHETTDLDVPEISISASLVVIVAVLAVTTVASLVAVRRDPALAGSGTSGGPGPAPAADPGRARDEAGAVQPLPHGQVPPEPAAVAAPDRPGGGGEPGIPEGGHRESGQPGGGLPESGPSGGGREPASPEGGLAESGHAGGAPLEVDPREGGPRHADLRGGVPLRADLRGDGPRHADLSEGVPLRADLRGGVPLRADLRERGGERATAPGAAPGRGSRA